jgi:hypothetical protein
MHFQFPEIQQDMNSPMKFWEVHIQNLEIGLYPEADVYQWYAEMNQMII